jgi:hypothetical protein
MNEEKRLTIIMTRVQLISPSASTEEREKANGKIPGSIPGQGKKNLLHAGSDGQYMRMGKLSQGSLTEGESSAQLTSL